jgi:dihydrofolate reductase
VIISHIAALAKNHVIGADGDLPWDLPEDMKFFREKTSGHIIVMGRKTFESFPKPLKNRLHVVITRQPDYPAPEGVKVFSDIDTALKFCSTQTAQWGDEVFVIGGGEIYKQTLDRADQLYLTLIDREFPGDVKYPEFSDQFILSDRDERTEPIPFAFCVYSKKKPL